MKDIQRDRDEARRARTLHPLNQHTRLADADPCPWNTAATAVNDACDNEILYAIHRDAAHALITEDQKLLAKARVRGLADRVYTIRTAGDLLARLHRTPAPRLSTSRTLSSTRFLISWGARFLTACETYDFDPWFRQKACEGRSAWIYRDRDRSVVALCIYAIQEDGQVNDARERLDGRALKLCTFKVGESVRGRKIGELLLKAAFLYATGSRCENIFIHVNPTSQQPLIDLLVDFGFKPRGR